MPELPEVQTIVNDLQTITDDMIIGFWTNFEKAIKTERFQKEVVGKKITQVKRIGKNVIFKLSNKKFIIIHLKMTGRLILNNQHKKESAQNKHLHHVFYLKKNIALEFQDIRKFGTIEAVSKEKLLEMSKTKGVDPLSKNFTLKTFTDILEGKKNKNVKEILMDQASISGIGNIYASEIPYEANISPLRKAGALNKEEIEVLHKSIIKILTKAIKLRGTSFSDYRDAQGKKGGFQKKLKVYGKAGKKCGKCDTIIKKVIVGQRSTFYCPTCQH